MSESIDPTIMMAIVAAYRNPIRDWKKLEKLFEIMGFVVSEEEALSWHDQCKKLRLT